MSLSLSRSALDHPLPEWQLSGWNYYSKAFLPFKLALKTNQKLMDFKNDVFGLILPYPHGSDSDPYMGTFRLSPDAIRMLKMVAEKDPRYLDLFEQVLRQPEPKYLHLFNSGEYNQVLSATADGRSFRDVEIRPMQRVIMRLRQS